MSLSRDLDDPLEIDSSALTISKKIGYGSFGGVYLARWNKKKVAIKQIKISECIEEINFTEIDVMHYLSKKNAIPHCVQFYGYSIQYPHYSIVMEYMPNGTLRDILDSPRLDPMTIHHIMKDITHGLSFLHNLKIVHRDIKCQNILLDEQLRAKLGDFGLAKKIDTEIEAHGTPAWMAPELSETPHTEKADVFSLAVTFWEIFAKKSPFATAHFLSILYLIHEGRREEIPSHCPPKIAKLITWGWKQKPEDRPTTDEIAMELSVDTDELFTPAMKGH